MIYHNLLNYEERENIESKNVRNFTTRIDAYAYLENEVFLKEHFINHISETAKRNQVSYAMAYDVITNHLTDILYEIDKKIVVPEQKVKISIYGYFSLCIGFMISNTKVNYIKSIIRKRNE